MDKQIGLCTYNEISKRIKLLSNLDESQNDYAEQKKPDYKKSTYFLIPFI